MEIYSSFDCLSKKKKCTNHTGRIVPSLQKKHKSGIQNVRCANVIIISKRYLTVAPPESQGLQAAAHLVQLLHLGKCCISCYSNIRLCITQLMLAVAVASDINFGSTEKKKRIEILNSKNTSDQFEGMLKCMALNSMCATCTAAQSAGDKCAWE